MKLHYSFLFVVFAAAVTVAQGMAQEDGATTQRPKPKPEPVAGAPLLVTCDLACSWKLDGKARGTIASEDSKTAPLSLGQHLVVAVTLDGLDKIEKEVDVNDARAWSVATGKVTQSYLALAMMSILSPPCHRLYVNWASDAQLRNGLGERPAR